MHAQGGGQPTDTGKLFVTELSNETMIESNPPSENADDDDALVSLSSAIHVTKVVLDRASGIAHHYASLSDSSSTIQVGDTVRVHVDEDRRRLLSECHTAGHVVDAAMAKIGKTMKPAKAYHFLEGPYVEYMGSIDPHEKEQVQNDLRTAFCELIQANIATEINVMSKEEAHKLCNRDPNDSVFDMDVFADPRTDQIRVVTVANFSCPCGGTHVRSTGDLQANHWRIKDIKSKKGIVRVRYEQGHAKNKKKQ
jgi:Ser-tRNA(Ala) deacylase AlaX